MGGLRSCVAGIILATGVWMILTDCFGRVNGFSADLVAIALTAGLSVLWFGSKLLIKKRVSPIILICIAGAAGVLIYGWK